MDLPFNIYKTIDENEKKYLNDGDILIPDNVDHAVGFVSKGHYQINQVNINQINQDNVNQINQVNVNQLINDKNINELNYIINELNNNFDFGYNNFFYFIYDIMIIKYQKYDINLLYFLFTNHNKDINLKNDDIKLYVTNIHDWLINVYLNTIKNNKIDDKSIKLCISLFIEKLYKINQNYNKDLLIMIKRIFKKNQFNILIDLCKNPSKACDENFNKSDIYEPIYRMFPYFPLWFNYLYLTGKNPYILFYELQQPQICNTIYVNLFTRYNYIPNYSITEMYTRCLDLNSQPTPQNFKYIPDTITFNNQDMLIFTYVCDFFNRAYPYNNHSIISKALKDTITNENKIDFFNHTKRIDDIKLRLDNFKNLPVNQQEVYKLDVNKNVLINSNKYNNIDDIMLLSNDGEFINSIKDKNDDEKINSFAFKYKYTIYYKKTNETEWTTINDKNIPLIIIKNDNYYQLACPTDNRMNNNTIVKC